ncbi:hypothetical protein [Streptomyces sp. NPDC093093]|uniref:hypothetical protein n=1 Tax=Streptomyces sp. NPDC093093 TaxID=3366025 RepID=UPI003802F82D
MSDRPNPRPPEDGPDYSDLSNTVVAYRWVPRRQGREAGSRELITRELVDGLAEHAARRDARLVGAARGDFPKFRSLPRHVRRELLRTMWRQERWWRFGDLVLVRAWQHTESLATAEAEN